MSIETNFVCFQMMELVFRYHSTVLGHYNKVPIQVITTPKLVLYLSKFESMYRV